MTTRSRVSASLVAALVSAAALLVPTPPASAAPGFTITTDLPSGYPRQIPLAPTGQTRRLSVVVTSSEPVTVTARSYDSTLTIANPQRSLGITPQPTTLSFDVAALTPGFHQLDVQVDGSTGPPFYSIAVGFTLWTSGSPLFTGTSGLPKRSFGWQGTEHVAGLESSTRAVRMLTIVSDTFAYVGLPAYGRPTCTVEGNGCLRYAYDDKTRLLQVGTGIVAAVHGLGMSTDGLVPADEQNGELFGQHIFPAQDTLTRPRTVLLGSYRYSSPDYPTGLTFEKVTFRRDGTYSLAYAYDGRKVRKLAGEFELGKQGKITFRSPRGKVVQRGTVLTLGRPQACVLTATCLSRDGGPHQRGIWLILSGKKGKHPDGNLLQRVR